MTAEQEDKIDTWTVEVYGVECQVIIQYDDYSGPPWDREDTHGPVSDWETRNPYAMTKKEEEDDDNAWVLISDRDGTSRYYDWRTAYQTALKDGWGVGKKSPHWRWMMNTRQKAMAAVRQDFDYLKGWCDDDWCYVNIIVAHPNGEDDSVCGYESNEEKYLKESAREIAQELVYRHLTPFEKAVADRLEEDEKTTMLAAQTAQQGDGALQAC